MRIFYVITKSELGGAQVHVRDLMRAMKEKGHTVACMSYPGGWLEDEARAIGVQFFPNYFFSNTLNPFRLLHALDVVRQEIEDFHPDLVACHSSGAGFMTRLVVKKKIPTVFTAHSWGFTHGAPFVRRMIAVIAERWVSKYTSKIICVSDFDRRLAEKYGITKRAQCVTVYNGTVVPLVAPTHVSNTKKIRIISIGRLAYPKKYQLLMRSYAGLPAYLKDQSELILVGHGPDETRIRKEMKGGMTLITDAGPDRVRSLLQDSHICVLLSKHEGLPITLIEAMSEGLPVVASRVGGIPEIVDANTGILVSNTEESVRSALKRLLDAPHLRIAMGDAGYKKARDVFSLEACIERTVAVYAEVIRETLASHHESVSLSKV